MNDIDYLEERVRDLERLLEKLAIRCRAFDLVEEAAGWNPTTKNLHPEQYANFLRSHNV